MNIIGSLGKNILKLEENIYRHVYSISAHLMFMIGYKENPEELKTRVNQESSLQEQNCLNEIIKYCEDLMVMNILTDFGHMNTTG